MEETTGKTVEQAGTEVELFEAEAAEGRQHDPRSENAKAREKEKKKKKKALMNDSHEEELTYERADENSFKGSVSTENEEKMHAQDQLLHEEETTQRKRSNNSENEQHLAEESDDQEYSWSQSEEEGEEEEEEAFDDEEENEDFNNNVDAEFQDEYTRQKRPDEDDANDESPPQVGVVALLPEGIHLPRTAYDAAWSRLMDKVAARSAEETMLTQLQHRSEDLDFSLEVFRADVEAEIARHRARSSNYFKSNDVMSVDGDASSIESKLTRTSSSSLGMSGRSSAVRTPLSVRRTPLASRRSRGTNARLFTPLPGEQPAERPAGMVPALEMDRAMEGYLRAAQMARFRSRRLHAGGKPPIFG